ncbi:MAG TPA: MFS transporter [Steroidobacteraceae bacterium]|jgi:predicted MFS family arabinose efflux permease|nr:MFS transporter [Steroidobacteraceae bacterium]
MTTTTPAVPGLSGYQKWVVGLLAFLQFTVILDFMVISPLGAILMPTLKITPAQFGVVVSSYAFSAGAAGLLAAGFADRFDRKKLLLFFYCGFILGTLLCGIARSYQFLLFSRMITGVFAGVIGSTVFAITTDLFAYQLRGRVMGVIQAAFGASSVVGIPLGLYLSSRWGWNAPFLLIVAISVLVGAVAWRYLRPIDAHLRLRPDRSPLHHLFHTLSTPRYLQGFATTALLSTGGFLLMPYMSAFSVHNLGIAFSRLPLVYLITGACAMIAGPLIGRASDAVGKFLVFSFGCAATIIMVMIYTHLGVTPLSIVILINCLLFVGVTSRMISASAMISAIPQPADRGSYMSISSSIQQISGGIAAVVGGLIVTETSSGALLHFDIVGYVLVGSTLATLVMMYFISRRIGTAATLSSAAA